MEKQKTKETLTKNIANFRYKLTFFFLHSIYIRDNFHMKITTHNTIINNNALHIFLINVSYDVRNYLTLSDDHGENHEHNNLLSVFLPRK